MRKNNLETEFQLACYPLRDFLNKAVLVAEREHQISSLTIRTILVWGQVFALISGTFEFAYIYVNSATQICNNIILDSEATTDMCQFLRGCDLEGFGFVGNVTRNG